jgi:hypothetical protein
MLILEPRGIFSQCEPVKIGSMSRGELPDSRDLGLQDTDSVQTVDVTSDTLP